MGECNATTLRECLYCERSWTSRSLGHTANSDKKTSEIKCSFGGTKVFDENGNLTN